MSTSIQTKQDTQAATLERVLMIGDLGKLTEAERVGYYQAVCQSLGLNPLTRPFDYIRLNGNLTLYAKKDATDQLRKLHGVSITGLQSQRIDDVYVVTAHASTKDGREDTSTGAVTIGNLKGDNLANALMKAETKAKRRVTLSICGMGFLDETEIETTDAAPPPVKQVEPAEEHPLTKFGQYARAHLVKIGCADTLIGDFFMAVQSMLEDEGQTGDRERLNALYQMVRGWTKSGQVRPYIESITPAVHPVIVSELTGDPVEAF